MEYETPEDAAFADCLQRERLTQKHNREWRQKWHDHIIFLKTGIARKEAELQLREALYLGKVPANYSRGRIRKLAYKLGFFLCKWANRGGVWS